MQNSIARLALAGVLFVAACDRVGPTAVVEPTDRRPVNVATIACTADTRTRDVRCNGVDLGGNALVVGGQGVYVQLTDGNDITYTPADSVFKFTVTVQNLIPQALGTTDGVTLDPEGVRVGFLQTPVGAGGEVQIINADGTATFTAADQPYFQYDELLPTNATSAAQEWQFKVPPEVTTFNFMVAVAAAVQFPDGWVDLSPGADTVVTGAAAVVTPTVRSVVGNALTGQTITFASSDLAVATVDPSGNVTAIGPGTATITATSGVRVGSASIAVCPDLDVGETFTAVMPAAASLCLAGGAGAAAEYTYMPVNLSSSSALSLILVGSGIVPAAGPPSPVRGQFGSLLGNAPVVGQSDEASHHAMLDRDRELAMRMRGNPSSLIRRGTGRTGGAARNITAGVPTVGDLWTLNVAQGCSGTRDDRVGRVVSIGQRVIIVSDTTNPAGGFTTAQYDSIRLEFDSLAWGVDSANFGPPSDLDTNERVVAFYTRAVNELSPPASSSVTLGFFTARDLFSSAPTSCPRSNEGEIFYMLVPDPTGVVNSNVRTVSFVRGSTLGTMSHEFVHLINASRRIYLNGTWNGQLEEVWLNEGLAHISEELMFYRTSVGLAPRGNILVTQLTTGPNASRRVAAFNTYANPNFGRLRSWLQRPDTAGAFKTNDVLAVRGVTWAFLRYASDRKGGTEAGTWSELTNTSLTGVANLQNVLGVDPNTWLRDFTAAMYADDAVAGLSSEFTNPSWNYRSLYTALNGSYQLVPRPLSNGVGLALSYSRGGGTAYARFGVPDGGFAGVTALSGGVPPTSPYSLIVMRTK